MEELHDCFVCGKFFREEDIDPRMSLRLVCKVPNTNKYGFLYMCDKCLKNMGNDLAFRKCLEAMEADYKEELEQNL